MNEHSFSVSELNQFIHDVVASGFPSAVWVCGEIQGYRVDQKGHAYFELVENEGDTHAVKAKIRCSLWSSRRPFIESVVKRVENTFTLKDDIQVKFLCKVDFWTKGGALSLTVENIDPTYTLGKIALERQKLIALLKKNGVLDKNKQLQLAAIPLSIGLITSRDSAAYNDFMDELKRSGFRFQVFLVNSTMQGKDTAASVVRALTALNRMQNLDAVIITRGGGSIAELAAFDSQAIAEAIAASGIPVLSGIGHEINTTVADLAAHTYMKTPTAIAQFLVTRIQAALDDLERKEETVFDYARNKIEVEKTRVRQLAMTIHTETTSFFKSHHQLMATLTQKMKTHPQALVRERAKDLIVRREALTKIIYLQIDKLKNRITNYEKLATIASPKNTLRRGFSITRVKNGKVLRSISHVRSGEEITTELAEGNLVSQVVKSLKEVEV